MQFITSWEQKGIIKGRAEGRVEGRVEGELIARRETLLALLRGKFGEVPSTIVEQVEATSSKEKLEDLLRRLIHADSFAEVGLDGTPIKG